MKKYRVIANVVQFISMAVCLICNENIIILGIGLTIYGVSNYVDGKLSMIK